MATDIQLLVTSGHVSFFATFETFDDFWTTIVRVEFMTLCRTREATVVKSGKPPSWLKASSASSMGIPCTDPREPVHDDDEDDNDDALSIAPNGAHGCVVIFVQSS